jgi:hypothetical protein
VSPEGGEFLPGVGVPHPGGAVVRGGGDPGRVRVYRGVNFINGLEPEAFQDLSVFGGATLPGGVYVG